MDYFLFGMVLRSQRDVVSAERAFEGKMRVASTNALGEYDEALIWLRHVIDDRGIFVTYLRLPNQYPGLQEQPGHAEALKYLDSLQKSR